MKLIALALLASLSLSAAAFGPTGNPTFNFPKKTDWALAMIADACGIKMSSMKQFDGSSYKVSDGVIYEAHYKGTLYFQAHATNKTIFAKKTCLLEP